MLTPDQQVSRLKEQYVLLRGNGVVVRARVDELPVRQYISLLERGYRVALEEESGSFTLMFDPDGSTPRIGTRGGLSVVSRAEIHRYEGHGIGKVKLRSRNFRTSTHEAFEKAVCNLYRNEGLKI